MDLYDDDVDVRKEDVKAVAGWSTGIRMLNSQMQLKKASQTPKSREFAQKRPTLAPVMDFNKKNKKESNDAFPFTSKPFYKGSGDSLIPLEPKVDREYDPLWPNEYEKVVKEIKASLNPTEEQENSEEEYPNGKRPYIARNQRLARERFNNFNDRNPSGFSGFGGQPSVGMEDDFDPPSVRDRDRDRDSDRNRTGGIAIAPPPSLTESSASPPPAAGGGSGAFGANPVSGMDFAQKLMAKYGYKEGTGLGKNKQGITKSLQVEKTSRRGGRIINEDKPGGVAIAPPANLYGLGSLVAAYGDDGDDNENEGDKDEYGNAVGEETGEGGGGGDEYGSKTPPAGMGSEFGPPQGSDEDGFKVPSFLPPSADGFKVPILPGAGGAEPFKVPLLPGQTPPQPPKPSVTELIKNPTRIVLMKNMVGPGEVDEELEPEVKEECETKYGEIVAVKILEKPNVPEHECVQIYLEFRRIECAIKALVDLNGRFFGGREVQAAFYNEEQYLAGDL